MPGLPDKINTESPLHSLYEGIEYKEFWNGSQKCNLDELEHTIVRNLLPIRGRRILDVGCGYGRLANCYMERFQQVIMVDGSMSLLRQALEKTGGQAIYIACDVMHLPFQSSSFDAVLMIRVFHHIEDSETCLFELHRLLCNDGLFVFNYFNKQNPRRVLRWLIGSSTENPFTTGPAGVGSTLISHQPKAIHSLLQESGFTNMQYRGVGVLDHLEEKIRLGNGWKEIAIRLAPLLARSKVAPWILCQATTKCNSNLIEAIGITDLLQCPACGGRITNYRSGYQCFMCKRCYPVDDGIIDLRLK